MKLIELVNTLGYTNIEEHLKMTLISKQLDEYGEEDFIDLKTNIHTVCKYYNNEISEISADDQGIISVFIHQ